MGKQKIEGKCGCGLYAYYGNWWRWEGRKGSPCSPMREGYCPSCGYHLARDGFAYKTVLAELGHLPSAHTADEIREMGHTGDYSCERCGGSFDIEIYIWLCRPCYQDFLRWLSSQKEATNETTH